MTPSDLDNVEESRVSLQGLVSEVIRGMLMDKSGIEAPSGAHELVPINSDLASRRNIIDVLPEDADVRLLDYWRIISKRRRVVFVSFFIVLSTVTIGTLKQKPVYEGTVLIEINPEPPNILNFKEVLEVGTVDLDSYRETQFRILQSRRLAERVIQDLSLYMSPEFYRSTSVFGLVERTPKDVSANAPNRPPDTSSDAYRNSVKNFLAALDVNPIRRSNLVEVSFYSHDPKLAARVANELATDYVDENLQVKWMETTKASDWLSTQLVSLKGKLEKSEDSLQAYAKANSILFVEEKKNLANERLEQLQTEYTKAQSDRFAVEGQYSLIQKGHLQDLPGFLDNKMIQDMQVRLSDLQQQYAQLTSVVKPNYPKAVQLKKQIDSLQNSLDEQKSTLTQNIIDQYRSAVARERYLNQALNNQKGEVNEIAEKSIQYNILKREVDTNKQLYDGLLQRLKEAQVSAGLRSSNIIVRDPAEVPKLPVRPRIPLNLALGTFLGLGLGIGIAFLQEYLDNTLKNPDEVEAALRLPTLGVVPRVTFRAGDGGSGHAIVSVTPHDLRGQSPGIQTDPASAEAFRSIRTSILLSASPVPKVLLITSALPGEGKTTVSVNLGATLASLGSRVVVVDCDMRRPACHRVAGVENQPGLVQCLTGHVTLEQAVLPVRGIPNLSVLPCGPIPPNPAELLSSELAVQILNRLRVDFEHVLVDSPPLLSVADSRILSTLTDAVVLVARAFSTPREMVRRAASLLYDSRARILGVALNGIDYRKDGYSYSYYSGYGYGYDTEESDGPRAR